MNLRKARRRMLIADWLKTLRWARFFIFENKTAIALGDSTDRDSTLRDRHAMTQGHVNLPAGSNKLKSRMYYCSDTYRG